MHVVLLRLALGLYSVGFAHSVLTALQRKQTLFRPALVSVSLGLVLHVLSIIMRAMEVRYLPLTQQYEGFSVFGALAALGFLIAYRKYRIAPLSVFAFPLIFIMTFIANLFYDPSASIPPLLRSNWLYIHTLVFLGYAAAFIAFAAAIMYLIQEHALKSKHPVRFYSWLPSLEICDDLSYRSLAIGFPFITVGIIAGALWAQSAVGGFWAIDVKVLFSFLTWLVYLLLISYRLIAGWRGRKAAYLSIAGFIGVLMTVLGSDYFGGLHTFQ